MNDCALWSVQKEEFGKGSVAQSAAGEKVNHCWCGAASPASVACLPGVRCALAGGTAMGNGLLACRGLPSQVRGPLCTALQLCPMHPKYAHLAMLQCKAGFYSPTSDRLCSWNVCSIALTRSTPGAIIECALVSKSHV